MFALLLAASLAVPGDRPDLLARREASDLDCVIAGRLMNATMQKSKVRDFGFTMEAYYLGKPEAENPVIDWSEKVRVPTNVHSGTWILEQGKRCITGMSSSLTYLKEEAGNFIAAEPHP
jgi:hypothetical protein